MRKTALFITLFLGAVCILSGYTESQTLNGKIASYIVDLKSQDFQLYWRDDSSNVIGSIGRLKALVESKNKKLLFAMNGGMYMQNQHPLGLFIQDKKTVTPLNISSGTGNFYLNPNGVFYTTVDHKAVVCKTAEFKPSRSIQFATQSGPMLVIDGEIHPAFKQGSENLNIRNGVGVLPDGKVLFAISKGEINFYDFAQFFKDKGCQNALYLDGFVSRAYIPSENWKQLDGSFGVIVGVTTK